MTWRTTFGILKSYFSGLLSLIQPRSEIKQVV